MCRFRKAWKKNSQVLPEEYSHLYLAIDGKLAAVICIEDPLRQEASRMINSLKRGRNQQSSYDDRRQRTYRKSCRQHRVGVDEYYSEVLPEDKAKFRGTVKKQQDEK